MAVGMPRFRTGQATWSQRSDDYQQASQAAYVMCTVCRQTFRRECDKACIPERYQLVRESKLVQYSVPCVRSRRDWLFTSVVLTIV